jgi:hypothetical protein
LHRASANEFASIDFSSAFCETIQKSETIQEKIGKSQLIRQSLMLLEKEKKEFSTKVIIFGSIVT